MGVVMTASSSSTVPFEHRGHSDFRFDTKQTVATRTAKIAVQEQDFLARLGNRDGDICRKGRFAVAGARASDLDYLCDRRCGC